MLRVECHPVLGDGRTADSYIYYDGQKIPAVEGEPIAAALLAAGVRTFRYTAKERQARGLFCGIGRCNDCKMVVDGTPNVRTCVTPVRTGMHVQTQHGLDAGKAEKDE